MAKQGLSEIVFIMDRSESMIIVKRETIQGFNNFVDEQKELPGEAVMTYTQFNTRVDVVYTGRSLDAVEPLTDSTYYPDGFTALLDAVGETIDKVSKRLKETEEDSKPEKVIVCIMTDGEENSSREFSNQQIAEKIKHQKEMYGWEFIFLGANQDAWHTAEGLSIDKKDAYDFDTTPEGIGKSYEVLSSAVTSYRTGTDSSR